MYIKKSANYCICVLYRTKDLQEIDEYGERDTFLKGPSHDYGVSRILFPLLNKQHRASSLI